MVFYSVLEEHDLDCFSAVVIGELAFVYKCCDMSVECMDTFIRLLSDVNSPIVEELPLFSLVVCIEREFRCFPAWCIV